MVFQTGCPYLDIINSVELKGKEELAAQFGFDLERPLFLFTYHPVTTEYGQGVAQARIAIQALMNFPEAEVVTIYSNADAGGREIIDEMKGLSRFHIFPNIENQDFLSLMRHASVMVGNSSAGIREAPSFQLPTVNIGTRQNGRLRAENVIDVSHDVDEIINAIQTALYDETF